MQNQELEHYLVRLEKALGPIPIGDKAEIITEIKSHVIEAADGSDAQPIHQILQSLGEPEQVASRYLLERGLTLRKPPRRPIIKWITIGFLGTFAITVLAIGVLVWKFTPLVQVDEEQDRVQLLGGLIDVNGKAGSIRIGEELQLTGFDHNLSGEEDFSISEIEDVNLNFSNGKFSVKNNSDNKFRYSCKTFGSASNDIITTTNKTLMVDFTSLGGCKCDLELPVGVKFVLDGSNGKVKLDKLKNHISVNILNGKIDLSPDPSSQYKYQTSVVNGKVANFSNSSSENAYEIKLSLTNGKIDRF